jgi:formamidopyrimidine-DNA glycosylase
MPELPEVTTTVNGLNEVLPNLRVKDVWSDYFLRTKNKRKDTIKNKAYFGMFKRKIVGEKFLEVERRGKNVLMHLTHGKTILIHMKMTGHLLYGMYKRVESVKVNKGKWEAVEPEELKDPYNKFIHLVFTLSNGKHLAFSDMRKFAKVILFETKERGILIDLTSLGPEPLEDLTSDILYKQIRKKPKSKIKTVLMDQRIIAGIGNIYSDEILWEVGIHPERLAGKISKKESEKIFKAMKIILNRSIKMGGDSMSDYRNIYGRKGKFQNSHKVYKRKGKDCLIKNCRGIIMRKVVDGRSAHFCSSHQK